MYVSIIYTPNIQLFSNLQTASVGDSEVSDNVDSNSLLDSKSEVRY